MKNLNIYAHRGASDIAPENTMAAFELARLHRADGIELDVQVTRDGRLVVVHDETVDRTSDGQGQVEQQYYDDLHRMDFGSWCGDMYRGERLPLFADVARLIRDSNMLVNIEIKPTLQSDIVEDLVIDICQKYDIVQQSVVSSFDHYALLRLKSKFPTLQTGILYRSGLVDVGKYASEHVLADSIHPHYLAMIEPTISSAIEYGQKIRTWVVDDQKQFLYFAGLGVLDAIITNRPQAMVQAYESMKKKINGI